MVLIDAVSVMLAILSCIVIIYGTCEVAEITWEDIVSQIKLISPKDRGLKKLETAYELLEVNHYKLTQKKDKTEKDIESLQEIKKSMDMISLIIIENRM